VLCGDALRTGALEPVLDLAIAGPYRFNLLTTQMAQGRQPVHAFISWLRWKAARSSEFARHET
jgi:hypothetical protein